MFDFNSLPGLLAMTVLVLVFWSILRRRAGGELNAWLLGWIFILVHFAVQLFGGRAGALQNFVYCIAGITLELAGVAFIYAAGGGQCTWRLRLISITGVFATLLYIVFDALNISSVDYYYAAAALLLVSGIAVLLPDVDRPAGESFAYVLGASSLAVALAWLARRGQQDYGPDCIFFVVYLLAGAQYWKHFPQRTTGAITAAAGFVGWACVFPISAALNLFAPSVHVQSLAWNIPKYIVAIGILLTLLEEEIDRTEHLALHDPLTGLPNRRLLEDRLTKAVERAERNEARVAVLLIDLDSFKQINDTYGHAVGDEVLRIVSMRLQMRVRKADTIARAGGDEFLVVVSDLLQPQGAQVLAGKLMADLNEPIVLGETNISARASIGVAIYPDDGQTAQALCEIADAAMYEQKRAVR